MDTGDHTVDVTRLFTAAVILPVQDAHPPADTWLQRLCRAILDDALGCLEGKGSPGGRIYRGEVVRRSREAWEWFLSDDEHCFSFATVCSVLNFDAEAVRRQIRKRFAQGQVAWAKVPQQLRHPDRRRDRTI